MTDIVNIGKMVKMVKVVKAAKVVDGLCQRQLSGAHAVSDREAQHNSVLRFPGTNHSREPNLLEQYCTLVDV